MQSGSFAQTNLFIMIVTIKDELLVEEVKECFSNCFPDLKIEFLAEPDRSDKNLPDDNHVVTKARIGEIRKKHVSDSLEIKPSDTVGKIENSFKNLLGLEVQVFKVENKNWTQVTTAGRCSLKVQHEATTGVFIYPKSTKQMNEYRLYL
jgi:hypothetical protein